MVCHTPVDLGVWGLAVSPRTIEEYFRFRAEGWSIASAAREVGISYSTALRLEKRFSRLNGQAARASRQEAELALPKEREGLSPEALRALDDFGFWRHRYLGRDSTPWQEEAAGKILEWLGSPLTEFVVENCPPGSGKTTKWTDVCAWLICRDRGIRIIWLSHTQGLAAQSVNRVRQILARPRPLPDVDGCLSVDYGRFRPEGVGLWTRAEFAVVGLDDLPGEDKEPTMAAYGMESEFLGHRANLVVGDDLQTGKLLKTLETIETTRKWWNEEGETRAEPGGVVVLNGQRMGAEDLYRYSLDQTLEDTDLPRYHHILYPAHYEDRCELLHSLDSPAYPEGCLLDPVRLPWSGAGGLVTKMNNRAEVYRVQYQQEDVDPADVLVPQLWIDGGRGDDGVEYPGCWDRHRGLCEWPKGLSPPYFSIATVDPSPSKFWAIEWWLYHPASEQRFLLDLERASMEAGEFLDWNANDRQFFGLAEDWQLRSKRLGLPITHWIIEKNAAQRFLLQYDHVKRWISSRQVQIIGHNTTVMKLSEEYGIEMLANVYRFGNVRLPGKNTRFEGVKDNARTATMKLVWEATHYPNVSTTDCLMAQYFLEFNLPSLSRPHREERPLRRPSWMSRVA